MPHPRIAQFDDLFMPVPSAGALGYRLPAEWEPQSCVWVSPPTNPETWPRCLHKASQQFEAWIDQLRRFAPVCTPHSLGIPTDDAWIRDYGPLFMVRDPVGASASDGNLTAAKTEGEASASPAQRPAGDSLAQLRRTRHVVAPAPEGRGEAGISPMALHDFHFNTWGEKYELRTRDDVVPQHLARWLGAPIWVHDLVLEGGAIESNGRGTLMTTEQCLLNPNRNPGWSRGRLEAALSEALGVSQFIWLPGGISGDDTDGHIDAVARFVSPDTVLACTASPAHPDHAMLRHNLAALREARDQDGEPLNVIELPMPEPMSYDYPPDRFDAGGRWPLPASYANFLIANGGVFVPTFGQPTDDAALRVFEQALRGYEIVPVRSEWLVVGQGTLHCLSMPQPQVRL